MKPAKQKKTSHGKFSKQNSTLVSETTTWKQRRDILASERGLELNNVITPNVKNHLFCYGAVCPRSCFCLQQKFDHPVSYKAGTSKVSTLTKSHVPKWLTQKGD